MIGCTQDGQPGCKVGEGATIFIVDSHSIFRLGMATCLEALSLIDRVTGTDTPAEAWERSELALADLAIVDVATSDAHAFVREMRSEFGTPSLAIGSGWELDDVVAMVDAGALGVMSKEALTPATLEANVRAAVQGTGVLPGELIGQLVGAPAGGDGPAREAPAGALSTREKQVLRLIAEGHGTREVAMALCYSERTIKNVLHDVATKLGARSRSHAVAHALRAGLI
jgi:DNA-binding NarL/FixJ family response regulator